MDNTTKPILVTGATGFIASHCIKLLLERGYTVRGTVRSLHNKEKYQFLYDIVPEKTDHLTLVEAELTSQKGWLDAVEGCDYIFHVASPIPVGPPKTDDEMISAAVEGTMNVLNAALTKGCRRVVVTASVASVIYGNEDKVINENLWSDLSKCSPYAKGKTLAEKAAWDFHEKNKDKIDIVSVLPSAVFGPILTKQENPFNTFILELLKGTFPGVPENAVARAVDVRDVAEAHINAMFLPEVKGKRFIANNKTISYYEIVDILRKEFVKYGYSFPSKKVTVEELKQSNNPAIVSLAQFLGNSFVIDNKRSIEELKIQYRNIEETMIDTGYSFIKLGLVENKLK